MNNLPSRYKIIDGKLYENPAHDVMLKYYIEQRLLLQKQLELFKNES